MFRKSALAMAMLGALTTGKVVALGLGDIELKSALNQPLSAEVELLSASDAELQELKVNVAPPEVFEKAGIDRPLFLSRLKFNVTRNDSGKPVVLITSREVIREPFLDFLLEISWSKGRLLREYTVLVDPPLTMPAAAPAVQAPAARVAPVQSPPVQSAPVAAQPRVRHTGRMSHTVARPAPGEYGPTRRNDTLWQIAQRVRPDTGVSVEQTMLGLLRANPEAFVGNNINNLKAGYVLRVPTREELSAVSRAEARRITRAQYAEWRAARSGGAAADNAVSKPVSAPAGTPAVTAAAEPSLQLVAPEGGGAASATGSAESDGAELEALQRDLIMANEALEAQRRQSEEMAGRLAVLEEQIRNMQRLIQLKDDALAQLQAQAGLEAAPADSVDNASVEAAAEAVADAGAETAADAVDTGTAPVDESVVDGVAPETANAPEADAPAVVDETPDGQASVDTAPAVDSTPVETPDETPVVTAPLVPETATTPGFVERLLNNPLWLGAGGAVLALLAFFGLRRKRSVETEFQESILQSGDEAAAGSDSEIVTAASGKESTAPESSLLSEFAVSDMGSTRTDGEADPLAEADVYLAYGRFQQAEDLIADALEKDPQNEDLNLKMLEVFLASRNQAAFDGHAELILARLENSEDPLWQKVAEMGRELSPDNPMYQPGGAASPADEAAPEAMDSLNNEVDFDIDGTDAADAAAPESAEDSQPAAADEDEGLDFDIDLSFDMDKDSAGEDADSVHADAAPEEGESAEAPAPELDIDMDSVEPDAIEQENTLDFDLDSLDLGEEEAEAGSGDGELADLDEVSTKLDLARAYIDMGDPDGARSILDEVIEEGSDEQKDEARGIMEQIA